MIELTSDFLSPSLLFHLKKQKYHLVGSHSAVKRCRWLKESLVNGRPCYKEKFYGIKSHRCVQMTPTVYNCTMRCLFCWRVQDLDLGERWEEKSRSRWDEPEYIIKGCLETQKRILSGYKGNLKTDIKKFKEALNPKHFAISLAGEPTLYPHLGEFIKLLNKRGFTSFLVTNGTNPDALIGLDEEPTQLYVSVYGYEREMFNAVSRPKSRGLWDKLLKTLSHLKSFKCKTVVRLTLIRHLNLKEPERYADLLKGSEPTYIEPKAYMHVGFSQKRLTFRNMPSHGEIREFGRKLAEEMGYVVSDESPESRVILLSRSEKAINTN